MGDAIDQHRQRVSRRGFVLYADVVFVTYTRSQVTDKEEFYSALKTTLLRVLSRGRTTKDITVGIFGCKELHEDGTPHYHVLLRFSRKVYWEGAREKLMVMISRNGTYVSDTHSIYLRKKPQSEKLEEFLYSVQTYIAKHGDVFGAWVRS